MHTLKSTTPSILLPCLEKRTKCRSYCFKAIYWQLLWSKFTLQSLLLPTWSTNKINATNQINRSGNTLLIDSHEIINPVQDRSDLHEIVYSVQDREVKKPYPLQRLIPVQTTKREYPASTPTPRLQMHPFYSPSSMATGSQGFDLTKFCTRIPIWMVTFTVFGYFLSRLTD